MYTLIFTGPPNIAAAAAASTAAAAAASGIQTLLASAGPSHPLAAFTGAAPGPEPITVAPELDVWLLDPLAEISVQWSSVPALRGRVAGDELPILPGTDLLLTVSRLRSFAPRYQLACVDAGPPDALLRALSGPDSFRWFVRLLLGLDRGPGRSSSSVARALIPTAILPIPMEWLAGVQDARARLEELRDSMVEPASLGVHYVLRPDRAGLDEARVALPALQLFGLAVEALLVGPLLDEALRANGLTALIDEQQTVLEGAAALWPALPLRHIPAAATTADFAALAQRGRALGADAALSSLSNRERPVRLVGPPEPMVAIDLPGLPREALGLTMSGDELIVRAGPFRRHLLLPEGLRGVSAIKAGRQGDTLTVRPRT